jgi:lysophosphatidate acyltransferase
MFPEGTRNRSFKGLLPFKKGAFHLAIDTQTPIIPIILSSMQEMFDADTGVLKRGTIHVTILPPIPVQGFTKENVDLLLTQVRDKMCLALADLSSTNP